MRADISWPLPDGVDKERLEAMLYDSAPSAADGQPDFEWVARESNKHEPGKLNAGRGAVGKTAVIGARERGSKKVAAKVIDNTTLPTLHRFIRDNVTGGSTVHTDDFRSYGKLEGYDHHSVKHSVGEYVNGRGHIAIFLN